jgi:hypothetical protein
MQMGLDRADGHAQRLGDVVVGEVEVVAQHRALALAVGQGVERPHDAVVLLPGHRRVLGPPRCGPGGRHCIGPVRHPPTAHSAPGQVDHGGAQVAAAQLPLGEHPQEGVLHHVLGGGPLAQQERGHGRVLLPEQPAQLVDLAHTPTTRDQATRFTGTALCSLVASPVGSAPN